MGMFQKIHSGLQVGPHLVARSWPNSAEPIQIKPDGTDVIFIIDSNAKSRESLCQMLKAHDFKVQAFSDFQAYLIAHQPGNRGCLLMDVSNAEASGIQLIKKLKSNDCHISVIAMATNLIPATVVKIMKAGASDCLEKPIVAQTLVDAIEHVIEDEGVKFDATSFRSLAIRKIATLTSRQREILELVVSGQPTKNIAFDLQISQRTVENHRAAIAKKTCSRSLSDVIHTAICAKCSLMKTQH